MESSGNVNKDLNQVATPPVPTETATQTDTPTSTTPTMNTTGPISPSMDTVGPIVSATSSASSGDAASASSSNTSATPTSDAATSATPTSDQPLASTPAPTGTSAKIETLLEECVKRNASDLHIQYGLPPILRVDGALTPIAGTQSLNEETIQSLIFATMDEEQQKILLKDKEFDYSFAFGDVARFRVNAFYERGKLAAAFRLIPTKIPSIEELGMPEIIGTFADFPRGLVLVTGPTGSGKSTTLAALVGKINHNKALHIVTIEDPVEFTHKSDRSVIVQREVHYDTFSFNAALRSVLREDPDVVLIGEMRDLETMQSAITIAETGHLVFATLHTNSAAQSIDRMIDVFPAYQQPQIRSQLSNILMAICAQRLVPSLNGGRVVAAEIMVANSAIRTLIRDGKTHQIDTAIQTGAEQGMQTMDRTLVNLVRSGTISFDEAREYAVDVNEFERLARG